jgi:hypothetical protein
MPGAPNHWSENCAKLVILSSSCFLSLSLSVCLCVCVCVCVCVGLEVPQRCLCLHTFDILLSRHSTHTPAPPPPSLQQVDQQMFSGWREFLSIYEVLDHIDRVAHIAASKLFAALDGDGSVVFVFTGCGTSGRSVF